METRFLCIATCVLLLTAPLGSAPLTSEDSPSDAGGGLSLERIFSSDEFETRQIGLVRWLEDGRSFTVLEDPENPADGDSSSPAESDEEQPKEIVRYECETGKRTVMVPLAWLTPDGESAPLPIDGYAWSEDEQKLLLYTNAQRVWRQDTRGDYWVLNMANRRLRKLGGEAEPATMMFAKFSPDGTRVAYVRERDLYVQDLSNLKIIQLTQDGSDTVINGTSDWVNEEEFGLRDGFRWSPDGRYIAYWQFDTEGVGDFHLINYTESLYPKITTFKYPKVGQTNSACRVGVVRAEGGETQWFDVYDDPRNNYIPRMEWVEDPTRVLLQKLNRLQNTNRLILGNVRNGRLRTILTERDEAWVDVPDDAPKWLEDGRAFIWPSERDGWRHLYRVSRSGEEAALLTPGPFDAIGIEGIDQDEKWLYYIASPEDPTERYLYRSALDGSGKTERVTPAGQNGTHAYQLSPGAEWAIHTYSSADNPPITELVRLPDHVSVRVLEDNSELRARLATVQRRPPEFFRVDIGDGIELDGWCVKPPDFDPRKQYPLLFYVYGEPAGSTVNDKWGGDRYLWYTMLAQRGYLVVSVDNRGTKVPRGRAWRKCIYRQIGILASREQAAAARAIIREWPFVDPNRVGIWGWSGGGSMSLNAIFRYPDLYHTSMAIAFVSNQRFYDTIYQERYMGLPDDNEEGYREGSPITYAHQLKGNLLIVYGTGDDNCHYQNCEVLVNELIEHNKIFSMMSYPSRSHSLKEGENTRRHLYELLTHYLTTNLPPGPDQVARESARAARRERP